MMSLLLVLLVSSMFTTVLSKPHTDADKTIAEYLISYGYAFQQHKIVTSDGYILTLWRIPRNMSYTGPRGPPVLLHHGIMDTGFSFLFQSIKKNLPTILVDNANFDVWIANSRGNVESLEHIDKEGHDWREMSGAFWDFSWDEMAAYDLPAVLQYISAETGYQKIKYVCHSQGCTILLALSCMNLRFVNKHIDQVVMLAPALYFIHQESWILHLLLDKLELLGFFSFFRMKNLLAHPYIVTFSKLVGKYFPKLWLKILNLFLGPTKREHIDRQRVPVIASHEIGGTSLQNMKHWNQGLKNDTFRKMDFGKEINMIKYGQPTPPLYDVAHLKLVEYSSIIFAFANDTVITPKAVQRLANLFPDGSYMIEVVNDTNHVSGYWGDIASELVFPKVKMLFQRRVY